MTYNKITFLCGVGGNRNGIGEFFHKHAQNRRPVCLVSYDDFGVAAEAANIAADYNVESYVAFRPPLYTDGGNDYLNPPYYSNPEQAATIYYDKWIKAMPPEAYRYKSIYYIWGNEPPSWTKMANDTTPRRTPEEWGEWWGQVALKFAAYADNSGFRTLAYAWSAGTPWEGVYEAQAMREYIRMCGETQRHGIAFHEGADPATPPHPAPIPPINSDLNGRFRMASDVAIEMGVEPPPVFITEFAFRYNQAPSADIAVPQLYDAAQFYAQYSEVKAVSVWTLMAGSSYIGPNGKLWDTVQKYIEPVGDFGKDFVAESIDPPPDPEPEPKPKPLPEKDIKRVVIRLPRRPYTDKELEWLLTELNENGRTITQSADDAADLVASGNSESLVILLGTDSDHEPGIIEWFSERGASAVFFAVDVPSSDTFKFDAWPTDYKLITQEFGANPERYIPYGLPAHEGVDIKAPIGSPYYAVADGEVSDINFNPHGHNYGVFVRVKHRDGYETTYAHASTINVVPGQEVKAGDRVATSGNTGNTSGPHLHLTLKKDGATGDFPNNIIDPTPFLLAHRPERPYIDGYMAYAGFKDVDELVGIHLSADSYNMADDVRIVEELRPGVLKALSSHNPGDLLRVATIDPGATWIIRAFLDFGERKISADKFFEYTIDDVERSVDILLQAGVDSDRIHIEIHNEPNLTTEGWGISWTGPRQFSEWLMRVAALYRTRLSNKLLYPGLSPGQKINGLRFDSDIWMEESDIALNHVDGLAIHVYWGADGSDVTHGVLRTMQMAGRYPGTPIFVTEFSNNFSGHSKFAKAKDYVELWKGIRGATNVMGATAFVISASDPVWGVNGTNETWSPEMAREARIMLDR